ERGELATMRARHAEHFAHLLAEAVPHLTTAGQLAWFGRLGEEHENVLAAMRYYCDIGDADSALTVAVGLASHAMMLGNHPEISAWLGDALAVPGGDDQLRVVGRAIYALNTWSATAPPEQVEEGLSELGTLARQLGDVDVRRWPVAALL